TVPWRGTADERTTAECLQRFHALHRQLYTFAQEDAPVEIVTLGVTAVGTLSRPTLPRLPVKTSVKDAIVGTQPVFFQEGLRDCNVYDRNLLGASAQLVGPAIIIQLDATTLVGPDQRVRIDEVGSMIIDMHA
ncbi:MAG: hydantoinase/oxoprolinase family protein, partial [Gemmatimonas sp.]